MSESTGKSHFDWAQVVVSILSLAVAFVSVILAGFQHQENVRLTELINLDPGTLIVHKPTEYCIARGWEEFPSDHLVLPIYFENTGSGAKTIERLTLLFEDPNTGARYRYLLAGSLPQLNLALFDGWYDVARAITVPARSLDRYVLVFHPALWWDESSEDFVHRFRWIEDGSNRYDMRLAYYTPESEAPVYWQQDSDDIILPLRVYGTFNRIALAPSLLANALDSEQVQAIPALAEWLANEPTGDYNVDCFAVGDFADFES